MNVVRTMFSIQRVKQPLQNYSQFFTKCFLVKTISNTLLREQSVTNVGLTMDANYISSLLMKAFLQRRLTTDRRIVSVYPSGSPGGKQGETDATCSPYKTHNPNECVVCMLKKIVEILKRAFTLILREISRTIYSHKIHLNAHFQVSINSFVVKFTCK